MATPSTNRPARQQRDVLFRVFAELMRCSLYDVRQITKDNDGKNHNEANDHNEGADHTCYSMVSFPAVPGEGQVYLNCFGGRAKFLWVQHPTFEAILDFANDVDRTCSLVVNKQCGVIR